MSDLVLHPTGIPRLYQCLITFAFRSCAVHIVHMFAVIMVAEEEKTEDCVIVTIASNAT